MHCKRKKEGKRNKNKLKMDILLPIESLYDYLKNLGSGFEIYEKTLIENGITTVYILNLCFESDLKEIGIPLGVRKLIIKTRWSRFGDFYDKN
jgi:SAM domain (Sterile alpha motif)